MKAIINKDVQRGLVSTWGLALGELSGFSTLKWVGLLNYDELWPGHI